MIDLLTDMSNPVAVILDILIALIVINWVWINALKPTLGWVEERVKDHGRRERLNRFADHWTSEDDVDADSERWKVLQEIADQFKPNGGTTLPDQVTDLQRGQARLEEAVEKILNTLDEYVIQRQPGGRRSTDPRGE